MSDVANSGGLKYISKLWGFNHPTSPNAHEKEPASHAVKNSVTQATATLYLYLRDIGLRALTLSLDEFFSIWKDLMNTSNTALYQSDSFPERSERHLKATALHLYLRDIRI